MNWYVAKLIFRITCGDGNHLPQFDEQLRLISAKNEQEALSKARRIISDEQNALENTNGKAFRWNFINMTELYQLDELKDGSEIYCNITEVNDADQYIEECEPQQAHAVRCRHSTEADDGRRADERRPVRKSHDHRMNASTTNQIIRRCFGLAITVISQKNGHQKINDNNNGKKKNILHPVPLPCPSPQGGGEFIYKIPDKNYLSLFQFTIP